MPWVERLGNLSSSKGYTDEPVSIKSKFLWVEPLAHFLCCNLLILQIAFTRKKDFGKEERELKWAHAQRTLHGLQPPETKMFSERNSFNELNQMAEEAKRRAEIARYACNDNKLILILAASSVFILHQFNDGILSSFNLSFFLPILADSESLTHWKGTLNPWLGWRGST